MSSPSSASEQQNIWGEINEANAPPAAAPKPAQRSPAPAPAARPLSIPPTKAAHELIVSSDDLDTVYPPPATQGFTERMWAKCKKEPLIPIGFLSTVSVLGLGVYSMSQGNTARQQKLMRARVGAQAFTIGAFVFGLFSLHSKDKAAAQSKLDAQRLENERQK